MQQTSLKSIARHLAAVNAGKVEKTNIIGIRKAINAMEHERDNPPEMVEDMRRQGDIRQSDLADEILALIDLEEEVAEPYSDLCSEIDLHVPNRLAGEYTKALEWLGVQSNLLEEIEKYFADAGRETGTEDVADMVKELLGTMKAAEAILEEHGWPGTDFLDALENLAENTPTKSELTYDL